MISPEGMPASAAPAIIRTLAAALNRYRAEKRERGALAASQRRRTRARSQPARIRHPGRSRRFRSSAAESGPAQERRIRSFRTPRERPLQPAAAESANARPGTRGSRILPGPRPLPCNSSETCSRSRHMREVRQTRYNNVEHIILEACRTGGRDLGAACPVRPGRNRQRKEPRRTRVNHHVVQRRRREDVAGRPRPPRPTGPNPAAQADLCRLVLLTAPTGLSTVPATGPALARSKFTACTKVHRN
jgi:hypothetical protein